MKTQDTWESVSRSRGIKRQTEAACFCGAASVCVSFPSNKDPAWTYITENTCLFLVVRQRNDKKFWFASWSLNRFLQLLEQLSNETLGCEIAFLPWMSNNCLGEEITMFGVAAVRKLGSNNAFCHFCLSSGAHGTQPTNSWHRCFILFRWNKRKPLKMSTRQVQDYFRRVFGAKSMRFVLLPESLRTSKSISTAQLVWLERDLLWLKEDGGHAGLLPRS